MSKININNPCLFVNDFDVITSIDEVSNLDNFSQQRCSGFNNWIFQEGLVDMGFLGPKFT